MSETELFGLVIEETGLGDDSKVPRYIVSCFNALSENATFENGESDIPDEDIAPTQLPSVNVAPPVPKVDKSVGLNLSYTINLNLPATTDIAVFNAIFKSLKENMLEAAQ